MTKKKINVTVTTNDIINAINGSNKTNGGFACPVERALRRATRTSRKVVTVGYSQTTVGFRHFTTPVAVKNFVSKFDANKRDGLKPFTFTLTER